MIGGHFTVSECPSSSKLPGKPIPMESHYQVQIIELVEAPPPPRRLPEADSDTDDEGPAGSEYCSSEEDLLSDKPPPSSSRRRWSDTYPLRAKRVISWREDFFAKVETIHHSQLSSNQPTDSHKRKHDPEDDMVSQTSKRSRLTAPVELFPCPACDILFPTRQELQHHGTTSGAAEACAAAVEYSFEQNASVSIAFI
ncbi:hypothetical protein DL96DRAFT_1646413, partial [Flagelloscypha sp. PMI_526]